MSFWRTFGFHTVSAIDTILDKEEFTLEELLDEEEILQEVKSQNKRLLDFLTQGHVLKKLLEYVTVEAEEEADSKRKFKFPFLACEILCSDVWTICDAVYKDESLVRLLYSFLEQPAPLNPQLANHVCRSAGMLLQRKITETVDYMKNNNMIDHFIKHLNDASVMDLLLKVISCEETSEGSGILDWLCETDLIPCLVSKFDRDNSPEVHENAAQALVDIISVSGGVASSPLIRQLESQPIVSALFDHILQENPGSALLHGLTVAIELLARAAAEASAAEEPLVIPLNVANMPETIAEGDDAVATPEAAPAAPAAAKTDDAAPADADGALSPLLAQTMSRLEAFSQLLKAQGAPKRSMSTGESLEPFGFEKLKVMEFFAMVVRLNCAAIDAELLRLGVFATAMDAFFKYTWNNFLHATVEQIVGGVLDGDNVDLQCSLVTKTKLLDRIVDADKANEAEEGKPRGVRRGFMGHLTAIALRVQSAAARAPALETLLNEHAPWTEYVNGSLARLRAAESKPLGGHRPMGGPGESSDEDEEEMEDDGDSIFDRYQLGFGTEEFGDEDEDDDDRDIHFDDDDEFARDDTHGAFEMYEDGSDDSGDEGMWPADSGVQDVVPADAVDALVANVEATDVEPAEDAAPAAEEATEDAPAAEAEQPEAEEPAAEAPPEETKEEAAPVEEETKEEAPAAGEEEAAPTEEETKEEAAETPKEEDAKEEPKPKEESKE